VSIRISIVEDDVAVRQSLRLVFELNGFTVAEFETGEAFLDAQRGNPSDCVVMDVHLPGADGLRTLERFRAAGHRAPVFMMTARPNDAIRIAARRLGAAGFFEKPVSARDLVDAIGATLV
jgi:two-component system, LuxR family, response regulator FixJ